MMTIQIFLLHSKQETLRVAVKKQYQPANCSFYSAILNPFSFFPLFSIKSIIFFKAFADPLPYFRHSIIYHINIAAIKN